MSEAATRKDGWDGRLNRAGRMAFASEVRRAKVAKTPEGFQALRLKALGAGTKGHQRKGR